MIVVVLVLVLVVPWSLGVVLVVRSYRRMHTGACVHLHTDEGGGGGSVVSGKGAMKEKEKEGKQESRRQAGSLYLANPLKALVRLQNL